jgi:hypothetical protein
MAEVLQLRCELEQSAIIKELMFGGVIVILIQAVLNVSLLYLLNQRQKSDSQSLYR